MKKFLIVLCTLLTACSLFQGKEERFVNPLFYETLHPIPTTEAETRLTPTKIYSKSTIPEKDCKLLKNTKRELIFSCEYNHPHEGHVSDVQYKYILSDDFYTENCQLVYKYDYHINKFETFPSSFCIHKDEI